MSCTRNENASCYITPRPMRPTRQPRPTRTHGPRTFLHTSACILGENTLARSRAATKPRAANGHCRAKYSLQWAGDAREGGGHTHCTHTHKTCEQRRGGGPHLSSACGYSGALWTMNDPSPRASSRIQNLRMAGAWHEYTVYTTPSHARAYLRAEPWATVSSYAASVNVAIIICTKPAGHAPVTAQSRAHNTMHVKWDILRKCSASSNSTVMPEGSCSVTEAGMTSASGCGTTGAASSGGLTNTQQNTILTIRTEQGHRGYARSGGLLLGPASFLRTGRLCGCLRCFGCCRRRTRCRLCQCCELCPRVQHGAPQLAAVAHEGEGG